jgi:uncharacterized protein
MKLRKKSALVASVFALSLLPAAAQKAPAPKNQSQQPPAASKATPAQQGTPDTKIDPAKETDIRKLLDMMGTKALAVQTMDATMNGIRPMMASSLPPGDYKEKLIDLFLEKFRAKADPQQVVDMVVPIYDKHLSHEEIKGLIAFYATPLGKKALSVLPAIAAESGEAGQKWGESLGRDSMREVLAAHPDLASALQSAAKNAP